MDQSLKARLIGATVLVILAVLLIPELLSGHKATTSPAEEFAADDRRTFTIDIGKSGGTMTMPAASRPQPAPARSESANAAALSPDRTPDADDGGAGEARAAGPMGSRVDAADAPSPSAESTSGAAADTPRQPSASAAAPVGTPTTPTTDAVASGGYFVQVGAFGSADSARKLVTQLEAAGYPARIAPVSRNGKTLHRVRVGPAASRADAQQLAARLKARGLPASLITSD